MASLKWPSFNRKERFAMLRSDYLSLGKGSERRYPEGQCITAALSKVLNSWRD